MGAANFCYTHDIRTRNRYQILVPENWYQNPMVSKNLHLSWHCESTSCVHHWMFKHWRI